MHRTEEYANLGISAMKASLKSSRWRNRELKDGLMSRGQLANFKLSNLSCSTLRKLIASTPLKMSLGLYPWFLPGLCCAMVSCLRDVLLCIDIQTYNSSECLQKWWPSITRHLSPSSNTSLKLAFGSPSPLSSVCWYASITTLSLTWVFFFLKSCCAVFASVVYITKGFFFYITNLERKGNLELSGILINVSKFTSRVL